MNVVAYQIFLHQEWAIGYLKHKTQPAQILSYILHIRIIRWQGLGKERQLPSLVPSQQVWS